MNWRKNFQEVLDCYLTLDVLQAWETLIASIILYNSLIYPFLICGLYNSTFKSLIIFLEKRAIRIITFLKPDEHYKPLFKELEILKLTDLITLYIQCTLSHYYYKLSFSVFFWKLFSNSSIYTLIQYIRLASNSTYYINTIESNHGKFNIRFAPVKVWNHFAKGSNTFPLKRLKQSQVKHLTALQFLMYLFFCNLVFFFALLFVLLLSFLPFSDLLIVFLKLLCQPTSVM